jgi:hypothetical protein
MALWVTAPQLWIEADGCGQVPPQARLSHQAERSPSGSPRLGSGSDRDDLHRDAIEHRGARQRVHRLVIGQHVAVHAGSLARHAES